MTLTWGSLAAEVFDLPWSGMSLEEVRKHALAMGMADERGDGLISDEDLQGAREFFQTGEVHIEVEVTRTRLGYLYIENIYIPILTLIRLGVEVRLVYWKLELGRRNGTPGTAYFGFWVNGCAGEVCSSTAGEKVVVKLREYMDRLAPVYGTSLASNEREKYHVPEITVNGDVTAKFLKVGKAYDVDLKATDAPYLRREGS